jgi:hypothetical protein
MNGHCHHGLSVKMQTILLTQVYDGIGLRAEKAQIRQGITNGLLQYIHDVLGMKMG